MEVSVWLVRLEDINTAHLHDFIVAVKRLQAVSDCLAAHKHVGVLHGVCIKVRHKYVDASTPALAGFADVYG
jgi:hypothetical protein